MTANPSTSMPCKCRLIRPDGTQRVYFRAESVEDAQRRACRILKKKALPEGWKLIVDGKAAECFPRAEPAPRPFQVGDRVRRKEPGTHHLPAGTLGSIKEMNSRIVAVKWDNGFAPGTLAHGDIYADHELLELVEPIPQPKAEELLAAAIKQSTDLAGRFQDAFGLPGTSWAQLIDAARHARAARDQHRQLLGLAEGDGTITDAIKALKSRVEEARLEAACDRERAEAAERDARACAQERDIATSKLDDIKAIMRTASIMHASKVHSHEAAMHAVLARG